MYFRIKGRFMVEVHQPTHLRVLLITEETKGLAVTFPCLSSNIKMESAPTQQILIANHRKQTPSDNGKAGNLPHEEPAKHHLNHIAEVWVSVLIREISVDMIAGEVQAVDR